MTVSLQHAGGRAALTMMQGALALALLTALVMALPHAGWLYARLLPQVTDFELTRIAESETGKPLVWGHLTKPAWATCTFVRVDWYIGRRGAETDGHPRHVTFIADRGRPPVTRPPGRSAFGPWQLDMPAGDWCLPQYADAVHECGTAPTWRFEVRTPIWQKKGSC